jgi:hypothetical protein
MPILVLQKHVTHVDFPLIVRHAVPEVSNCCILFVAGLTGNASSGHPSSVSSTLDHWQPLRHRRLDPLGITVIKPIGCTPKQAPQAARNRAFLLFVVPRNWLLYRMVFDTTGTEGQPAEQ